MDMLEVICYGGVGEIGGNKILLRDSGSSIMLDFGKSFSAEGRYFDEFLQPRTNSCLRDLLSLGILPKIPGIYRDDLLTHGGVWDTLESRGIPNHAKYLYVNDLEGYEDYEKKHGSALDGILLSHAHTDHAQNLCYVDPRIPIYCTQATLSILTAAEEIGKGSYESDLIYCRTRRISACGDKSTFPGALKIDTDGPGIQRDFRVVEPYNSFSVGGFGVTCIPVDHSVPGACAFYIISPSNKKVFYSGDLRFHGRFSEEPNDLTRSLRAFTKGLEPDVVITEGTRIDSNSSDCEQDVEDNQESSRSVKDPQLLILDGRTQPDLKRFETWRKERTGF